MGAMHIKKPFRAEHNAAARLVWDAGERRIDFARCVGVQNLDPDANAVGRAFQFFDKGRRQFRRWLDQRE